MANSSLSRILACTEYRATMDYDAVNDLTLTVDRNQIEQKPAGEPVDIDIESDCVLINFSKGDVVCLPPLHPTICTHLSESGFIMLHYDNGAESLFRELVGFSKQRA